MALSKSQQFLDQWMVRVNQKAKCNKALSLERYNEVVAILKVAIAKTGSKTPEEYNLLRRFDMVSLNGIQKLIKKTQSDDLFLYYPAS